MSTHLLNGSRGAWVNEAQSTKTYADKATLRLDGTGDNEKRAFLWFPNPVGRAGDTVLSATLRVFLAEAWSGTTEISVKRVTTSWKHASVKWGSSGSNPSVSSANVATATVVDGAAHDAVDIDVTAMLAAVAAGGAWYGVRIEIDANGPLRLLSPMATNPSRRPTLTVDITVKPDAPDALKPNGDTYATDNPSPTLRWEFSSSDENAYQLESRVQVTDEESDYTDPTYDSGWQSNDITDWDSALDAAGEMALDDGTQYWWQVRVRDQNGTESSWSDEATFIYASTGDIQIVDPEQDDDVVEDSSPVITWYTDDREQRSTMIEIYESLGGVQGDLIYRRNWTTDLQDVLENGDEGYDGIGSYTIPTTIPNRRGDGAPIISTPGAEYQVVVSMRDEYPRRDDVYISDTRIFTFEPGDSVTAPTALTATATAGQPYIELAWERGTTPDSFVIYRDGVSKKEIDGADALVSGTSYAWVDWTAVPGVEHSYTVRAKTEGSGISDTPTADTATLAPVGIWLTYPAQEYAVPILGVDTIGQSLAETSASFAPLNRRDAVRIVSRIGAYEGSVSGTLAEWNGAVARSHLATLEEIFGKYSTESLRLVFGARNYRVNVGGLNVSQVPVPRGDAEMFDVSFTYWQVADFTVEVN